MTKLGTLLSSSARTQILRTLHYQPEPIGLRPLARLAGVLPRSAELALDALANEHLVCVSHDSKGPRYAINREHADTAILAAVFTAATSASIASRSRSLSARATHILPFIRETGNMLASAKAVRHVA